MRCCGAIPNPSCDWHGECDVGDCAKATTRLELLPGPAEGQSPIYLPRSDRDPLMELSGFLGSVLSAQDTGPSGESASDARVTAEALGAALAVDQVKDDPRLARATEAFLHEQMLLLQSQREEIAELRGLRVAQLRGQLRESRMRYVGYRFRALLLVAALLVVAAVASSFGVMVYDAATSHSVIVDTFTAPPALAARGVTGGVVASDVLDALRKLQVATRTASAGMEARGAWANDIKIEVPRTGISIGEMSRLLHDELGHDVHIGGDLTQGPAGQLSLTVRGTDIPASIITGGPPDLGLLTERAAEYVYSRVQLWNYGTFLVDSGRYRDAIAFLPGALSRSTSDLERAELLNIWGDALPAPGEGAVAAEKFRMAMTLLPSESKQWWDAWSNVIEAVWDAQGEEAAWHESKAFTRAALSAPKRKRPSISISASPEQIMWEPQLLLLTFLTNRGGGGVQTSPIDPLIADAANLLHDPEQAALYMSMSDPHGDTTKAEAAFLDGSAALDRGDPAAAIAPLLAFDRVWLGNPLIQSNDPDQPCFLGRAYGLSGDLARAAGAFDQVSQPWSRCYAFRGDVLVHAGDRVGAQHVWAEGIRLLPDLPNVYLARGKWEMQQGDLEAASEDLSTASAKAPHFADPLKAWGDLLAREGRWDEARLRYDIALHYAPHWTALQTARVMALNHQLEGLAQ